MAQSQSGIETLYQGNFARSQASKTVEYRLLTTDDTGAPSESVAYTTTDVLDLGEGAYGVHLTLTEGRYSIEWHVDGTNFYANEEINILENMYDAIDVVTSTVISSNDVYSGYGN